MPPRPQRKRRPPSECPYRYVMRGPPDLAVRKNTARKTARKAGPLATFTRVLVPVHPPSPSPSRGRARSLHPNRVSNSPSDASDFRAVRHVKTNYRPDIAGYVAAQALSRPAARRPSSSSGRTTSSGESSDMPEDIADAVAEARELGRKLWNGGWVPPKKGSPARQNRAATRKRRRPRNK